MSGIAELLARLGRRRASADVANPYRARQRRENLRAYLEDQMRHPPRLLLVGEAPGHRGCARTGIPFTCGSLIRAERQAIWRRLGVRLQGLDGERERSAEAIWSALAEATLLWNAFPFHPHAPDRPDTNRRPRARELREGEVYLRALLRLFPGVQPVGVGRLGQRALERVTVAPVPYVRHPARTGPQRFAAGLRSALHRAEAPRRSCGGSVSLREASGPGATRAARSARARERLA